MEVAQIVITPKVSDVEKQKVIDRLNGQKKSKKDLVLLLKPFYI
jgi:peptidyl-prolyl cis-trans isomerase SurA